MGRARSIEGVMYVIREDKKIPEKYRQMSVATAIILL